MWTEVKITLVRTESVKKLHEVHDDRFDENSIPQ